MGTDSVAERVDLGAERSVEERIGFKVVGFTESLKWVSSEGGLVKRNV